MTSNYIVSDYLFFLLIPKERMMKVDVPISLNNMAGVSNGDWCIFQKMMIDYFLNNISIERTIASLIACYIKKKVKKTLFFLHAKYGK